MNKPLTVALIILVPVALVACWSGLNNARACISPPVDPRWMIGDAELILVLTVEPVPEKGQAVWNVRQTIKGDCSARAVSLDFTKLEDGDTASALKELAAKYRGEPAVLFAGRFDPFYGKGAGGFLHLDSVWLKLGPSGADAWTVERRDGDLNSIWDGGSDMLIRCVERVLAEPETQLPGYAEVICDKPELAATVPGKVCGLQAVDIEGNGLPCLFVTSEGGDRLYRCDRRTGKYADLTAGLGLSSRSSTAVWGDFDGDDRLDLASWNGSLRLHLRRTDGKFEASAPICAETLKGPCTGMAVVDVGAGRRAGLLVTTASAATVLTPHADGTWTSAALPRGTGVKTDDWGQAGESLVADFDDDRVPDVLQLFAEASVFHKGTGGGRFAEGVKCEVAVGKAPASAAVGDWDADGRLDVLCAAADRISMWTNAGGGKFRETRRYCGALHYAARPGAFGCGVCDINNDGWQDIYLVGGRDVPEQVQLLFNKGFRSFGQVVSSGTISELPGDRSDSRCRAGLLADLNGDAAQDISLALDNGEVWVLHNSGEELGGMGLGVTAALPLEAGRAGPVTVTGWLGKRCLGAWNVTPGAPGAFFGIDVGDSLTIKWHSPDGKPLERQIDVEDEPVRIVLDANVPAVGGNPTDQPTPEKQ